ncbi:MAG: hypothetical protein WDW38_005694 [Sanguina aurantia]
MLRSSCSTFAGSPALPAAVTAFSVGSMRLGMGLLRSSCSTYAGSPALPTAVTAFSVSSCTATMHGFVLAAAARSNVL